MSKKPLILGIESSCDETAASIISENDQGNPIVLSKDENFMIKILGFISFSLWVVTAASGRWIGFS